MKITKEKCPWCGVEAEQIESPVEVGGYVMTKTFCRNCKTPSSGTKEYYPTLDNSPKQ